MHILSLLTTCSSIEYTSRVLLERDLTPLELAASILGGWGGMDSHQKVKLLQEDFIYTFEVMAGESGSIVFGGR